ncbi:MULTISPECIES: hypothetical protein [unclassified Mesorhizobium]|uniref:hypothetical protein n=1 Tax=unclassified Mesorhizobium TaxID=325217 RepID=UPI00112C175B|nr:MULTISPECIES: hypothetical protein [unclassified Mesorhizobium]TPI45794.1 hypothetical protein FJW11_29125 [Mesorhizobium sp. B3-1-1]TPJ67542.1 hypothetical protein FJ462_16090 [Mesorhizobium sp. B2-6-7]TPJ77371.1 hypothetical protein FJ422_29015 [Mesorhizobium sp. B2-6-3]TPK02009.1 hypothetical protein FJ491_09750 [Mesorhizobium sp. B2-5-10]TPK03142.1 hypothetical protein FJ490_31680 [Mesorhizobium sp. B2-5-11]
MNDKTIPPKKSGTGRKDRLAEQLRANLLKRKAQSRSRRAGDADKRRAGDADKRPDGVGAAKEIQKD